MHWWHCDDFLVVAIGAAMVVGPGDVRRVEIVRTMATLVGVGTAGMKVMGCPDPPEVADGRPKIHGIPGRQHAAATRAKATDRSALGACQTVARVHGKQPELVEVPPVERCQDGVVRTGRRRSVTRGHGAERLPI